MDRFSCGYCGSEQIVERRGGTVALKLVVDAVSRVQSGTDRTAAELALARLEKEIGAIHSQWHAASADFARRKSPNSTPAVAGIVISVILGIVALSGVTGSASSPDSVGSLAVSFLLLVAAVAGVVISIKFNNKANRDYAAKRAALWAPYAQQIEVLELARRKHREIVDRS